MTGLYPVFQTPYHDDFSIDFDTLATYVHQYASDELLEECAFAALAIVAVGVLPVILLSRAIGRGGPEIEAAP